MNNKFDWFFDLDPFAQSCILTIAFALVTFAIMFVMYCLPVLLQLVFTLVIVWFVFYIAMKLVEEIRKG